MALIEVVWLVRKVVPVAAVVAVVCCLCAQTYSPILCFSFYLQLLSLFSLALLLPFSFSLLVTRQMSYIDQFVLLVLAQSHFCVRVVVVELVGTGML